MKATDLRILYVLIVVSVSMAVCVLSLRIIDPASLKYLG